MKRKIKIILKKSNYQKTTCLYLNGLVKEKYFVRERPYFQVSYFLNMSLEFRMLDTPPDAENFSINFIKYFPCVSQER